MSAELGGPRCRKCGEELIAQVIITADAEMNVLRCRCMGDQLALPQSMGQEVWNFRAHVWAQLQGGVR